MQQLLCIAAALVLVAVDKTQLNPTAVAQWRQRLVCITQAAGHSSGAKQAKDGTL